jgi:putative two-component system response regulator
MHNEEASGVTFQRDESGDSPATQIGDGTDVTGLMARLDALVQSYSDEQATPLSTAQAPPEANSTLNRTPPKSATPIPEADASDQQPTPERRDEGQLRGTPRREIPEELKTAKIMVVDDEEANIFTVQHYLKKTGYRQFITTTKAREAIELLRAHSPDVLLLDIRMPEISGLDILRAKQRDASLEHIPVLVLTAATDPNTKLLALELGASDFLTKPVDAYDLVPRVKNALTVKLHYDQKASEAARLEEIVRRRTSEVVGAQEQLILSLARAAEHRDNETGNHVLRVGRFAGVIARELGWSDSRARTIERAAPLHDVGKIGVPDQILFKPGKLDPQEFEIIKKHCCWGKQIIEPFSGKDVRTIQSHARVGENILHVRSSTMLMMASRIAQTHHECWDGTGYPLGLAGEDIPLEGRITAVADVFDALSTKRPYKPPFSRQKSFEILEEQRGKKFDPHVLDAFFARATDVVAVQLELLDSCLPETPHAT